MSNGEVIQYHKFISVVVIELSARYLNAGPEDRLCLLKQVDMRNFHETRDCKSYSIKTIEREFHLLV